MVVPFLKNDPVKKAKIIQIFRSVILILNVYHIFRDFYLLFKDQQRTDELINMTKGIIEDHASVWLSKVGC